MSVLDHLAASQGRRDERPNQELARTLAQARDRAGIREIVRHLHHPDRNIQSDCLKVLYEIGYLEPGLIAGYADDFLDLLGSPNNRMVWGSMIALATISRLKAAVIGPRLDRVIEAVEGGSVITVVWGVKALAGVAAAEPGYRLSIMPVFMRVLKSCPARDLPLHAESILPAVDSVSRLRLVSALKARQADLSPAQGARLRAVLRRIEVPESAPRAAQPAPKSVAAPSRRTVSGPGSTKRRKSTRGRRKRGAA